MRPWTPLADLPGDASNRRYSRVRGADGREAVRVVYPAGEKNRMGRDLEARAWCAARGLRVPELLDQDVAAGWAVHEDFGPDDAEKTLEAAPPDARERLGRRCIGPLATLAAIPVTDLPAWNPPLDRYRLRWELAGFELWFLGHRRDRTPSPEIGAWLDGLAAEIDTHPRRVCHRDYHLNNVFVLADGGVGLIDEQDILVGPDTYDGVSLLGERGMPRLLAPASRAALQEAWAAATSAHPGWRERWLQVRIQRALKVLGTFARLSASGDTGYERWIAPLAREVVPDAVDAGVPSALTDLLLDLSPRHHPHGGGDG